MDLIIIKIGGSVITDKNKEFTTRPDNIRKIAREIKQAIDSNPNLKIILGHGAGSFGHVLAKKYQTNEGIINKESWKG